MPNADLLRFATAGSVDDGKSSLIGRLLYDTKSILEDQMLAIEHASQQRGTSHLELALLTDGLRAEREQNITIDVAYRYFATDKRKFIIADTPGHLQYTRNMVTGASTADLAVILIDARKGVLSQSKRHAAISSLLGIHHLVVAVNKMDLVDFDQKIFDQIREDFVAVTNQLPALSLSFIPISALLGDNVVDRSDRTPWYDGPTLLRFLEEVDTSRLPSEKLRLPIQVVIRPNQDYRGFAGRIESGSVKLGDRVAVAATGLEAVVTSLYVSGSERTSATVGDAVTVAIDREIDVSRGDLLTAPEAPPIKSDQFEALICWLHEEPMEIGQRYFILHSQRRVSAVIEQVGYRLDIDTLEEVPAKWLGMNDLGRVTVRTAQPLAFDLFSDIPGTGSFVLVNAGNHSTVAAGMIQSEVVKSSNSSQLPGQTVWLIGFAKEVVEIARSLRIFGEPHVLLEVSDDLSITQIEALSQTLNAQGFHVLISSETHSGIQLAYVRDQFDSLDRIVETILFALSDRK